MIGWIILDSCIENVKVISKTFEFDWRAVWGWKGKCPPKHRLRLQNQFFFTLEKAVPEGREKARNPGDKEACVNSHRRLQNQFFFTLEKAVPEGREKASNPGEKEACVNVHRRLRNQIFLFFWYITLETAAPEYREKATHHSRKGACVYATYRDRSVCAVACYSRCITGSSCLRFLFAQRCSLNHSLFLSERFRFLYMSCSKHWWRHGDLG